MCSLLVLLLLSRQGIVPQRYPLPPPTPRALVTFVLKRAMGGGGQAPETTVRSIMWTRVLVKPLYGVQEIRPRSRTPTWYAAPVVLVTKPGRNGGAATTRVAPAGQRSMFPSWRHAPPRARR